jgi:Flp pilus assembly protein TadG
MRRLTGSWHRPATDGERGAVTVVVAILMVALLGFAAIAVDIGLLYSERAQLQNAADASALGVAQKCAKDAGSPYCSPASTLASELANQNSLDGQTNVASISLSTSARTVTTTTTAKETGSPVNSVSLFLANILGIPSAEVSARSTAAWGSPVAGRTAFPLAFSICQVKDNIDGALQLLQEHGNNANPDCMYGPSGAAVAGGFGWLVQDPGVCGGTIDLALSEGGSDPGNNAPGNCSTTLQHWADEINAGRDVTVLLPVFDSVTGTGSGASYHLISFAAFKVKGWKFTGDSSLPYTFQNKVPTVPSSVECDGNCRGIIGSFVKYVSLADGYTLGPVDPYGATIVRMTP